MNEQIDQLIKQNGERWAAGHNRTVIPVTISLNLHFTGGRVFDLTLPPNESHPNWRINEREMTSEESAELIEKYRERNVERIGALIPIYDGKYFRVRAHIRNGRANGWANSVENIELAIVRVWPLGEQPPNLLAASRGNERNFPESVRNMG
jgi:hypothetical protein